jgi:hypothetical protein
MFRIKEKNGTDGWKIMDVIKVNKNYSALTLVADDEQTAIGLPPVTSSIKFWRLGGLSVMPLSKF